MLNPQGGTLTQLIRMRVVIIVHALCYEQASGHRGCQVGLLTICTYSVDAISQGKNVYVALREYAHSQTLICVLLLLTGRVFMVLNAPLCSVLD